MKLKEIWGPWGREWIALSAESDDVMLAADAATVTSGKWNLLFPLGTRYRPDFPDGKIEFSAAYLQTIVDNWKRHGAHPVSMDYFHLGASHVAQHVPIENKVASGDIVDLELRVDAEPPGLYAKTEWTERAKKLIDAKELKRLSPYFRPNPVDTLTGERMGPQLQAAALLNDPFLDDLPRVAASRSVVTTRDATPHVTSRPDGETLMLQRLIAFLALSATATEAEVEAKVKELVDRNLALSAEAKTLKAKADEAVALSANSTEQAKKVHALQLVVDEQAKQLSAMQVAEKERAADAVVTKLEAGFHILPAQKAEVREYALSQGADKAFAFFSKFKNPGASAGEQGITSNDRDSATKAAASAKEANEKLQALARDYASKNKVDLGIAMGAVMADAANDALVTLAMQNTAKREY